MQILHYIHITLCYKLYRDARPRFDCILEKDEIACLKAVRDNGADITVIDGGSVKLAINNYNAKPIVSEAYGEGSTQFNERPAVAVVKSGSSISGLGIRVYVFKMQTFYIEIKSLHLL